MPRDAVLEHQVLARHDAALEHLAERVGEPLLRASAVEVLAQQDVESARRRSSGPCRRSIWRSSSLAPPRRSAAAAPCRRSCCGRRPVLQPELEQLRQTCWVAAARAAAGVEVVDRQHVLARRAAASPASSPRRAPAGRAARCSRGRRSSPARRGSAASCRAATGSRWRGGGRGRSRTDRGRAPLPALLGWCAPSAPSGRP